MTNNIDMNYVPAAGSLPQNSTEPTHKVDERVWKTRLDQDHKTYSAQVRILPNMKRDAQGNLDYDRVNPSPFRKIMVHYLRIGNGEKKYFKCLKTTYDGIKQKDICPFCDWTFNRWAMLKKAADAGDAAAAAELKVNQLNQASTSYVANTLIRADNVKPEFDGAVKIWDHSVKVNEWLDYPREPEVVAKRRWRNVKANRYAKDSEFVPDAFEMKTASRFYPEQVIGGRDFIVTCQESSKEIDGKPINSYDNSKFVDQPSNLANTQDEVYAILSQCVDLDEYQKEDLAPDYKTAQKMLNDWLVSQSGNAAVGGADDITPNTSAPAARPNPNGNYAGAAAGFAANAQPQQPAQTPFVTPPTINPAANAQPQQNAPVQPSLNGLGGAPIAQPTVVSPAQPQLNAAAQPQMTAPVQASAPVQPQFNAPAQPQFNTPAQPQFNAPAQPQLNAAAQPQMTAPAQSPFAAQGQTPAMQQNAPAFKDDDLPF
jgi:hypothetical protein